MIYILDTSTFAATCNSYVLYNLLNIMKTALNVIQIIGPILTIAALFINFTKLVANPDEKKYKKSLMNCLVATVMLFFIPTLINVTMGLLGETSTISDCWNNVDKIKAEIQITTN